MKNAIILVIATIVIVVGALIWKGKINVPFLSPEPATEEQGLDTNNVQNSDQQTGETATTTTTTTKPTTTTTTTKTTTTPSPAIAKDGAYIISYENTGFKPKTLTIQAGKSVRFINNSGKAMLIYSTNQTDRMYASLNQSKTVGNGGVYNYMFTQAGVYGYYNYNNKGDTGMIIVNPKI